MGCTDVPLLGWPPPACRDCSTVLAYKKGGEGLPGGAVMVCCGQLRATQLPCSPASKQHMLLAGALPNRSSNMQHGRSSSPTHFATCTCPLPLPGIISCLAPNPDRSGMLAAGSYSGAAALVDPRTRELLCLLEGGHAGGITHVRLGWTALGWATCCLHIWLTFGQMPGVQGLLGLHGAQCSALGCLQSVLHASACCPFAANQPLAFPPACPAQLCFSADGNFLYTGARKDGAIRCWDVRYGSGAALFNAHTHTIQQLLWHNATPSPSRSACWFVAIALVSLNAAGRPCWRVGQAMAFNETSVLPRELQHNLHVAIQAGVMYTMQRPSGGTNQRMMFDVEPCGRHLATGASMPRFAECCACVHCRP